MTSITPTTSAAVSAAAPTLNIGRRQCRHLHPNDALARVNLAIATMEIGDLEGALAIIQTALSMDPNCAPAHIASGDIYHRLGMIEEACTAYSRALAWSAGIYVD